MHILDTVSGLFFVWIIFYYVEAHEVRKHYGEYVREQIIVEKSGINLIIYFLNHLKLYKILKKTTATKNLGTSEVEENQKKRPKMKVSLKLADGKKF